ncbi:hypothetical protein TNCT_365881, partial [Trichonephila clavata]
MDVVIMIWMGLIRPGLAWLAGRVAGDQFEEFSTLGEINRRWIHYGSSSDQVQEQLVVQGSEYAVDLQASEGDVAKVGLAGSVLINLRTLGFRWEEIYLVFSQSRHDLVSSSMVWLGPPEAGWSCHLSGDGG